MSATCSRMYERAGDHPLGAVGHPALDAVDVGLRVLVDPALVAAVLGGVDGDDEGARGSAWRGGRRRWPRASRGRGRGRSRSGRPARRPRRACRAFMCSIQVTNSPRSRGRSGSRTRWTSTPPISSSGGSTPRARARARAPRRPGPRGSPPACARGGPGRPRSAAGTPRRGSGRAWSTEWQGREVEVAAPGCAAPGRERPRSLSERASAASCAAPWSAIRCERIVGGEVAR